MRPEVAITGMGAACAAGTGCDELWEALASGRDGLREITRFRVDGFNTRVAGLWPGWEGRVQPESKRGERKIPGGFSALELASAAAREAMARARMEGLPRDRIAVVLGTCFGEEFEGFSELTEGVARAVGAGGPCLTLTTACASSTAAIGLGRDLVEQGVADLVLAGGADALTREVFGGFHALGALSPGKCSPFGDQAGTSLGEGAGFVMLERGDGARARGVEPLAQVIGYGLSADAFHETAPDPSGSGIVRAVRSALADAVMPGGAIDYVNAHGTGTEANDVPEWLAIRSALGVERVPVSATKSYLGHAQGAAGVLELIATLLCVRRGVLPPTLRCVRARPGAPPDPVAGDRPRPHATRRFLKLSAAFGGANAALVVGDAWPRPREQRRAVHVLGTSAIGPHGLDLAALESAARSGRVLEGAVPEFDLTRLLRWAAPRGLDPSARFAAAGAGMALADAGIAVRGELRDRAGLFTGNARMPASSAAECLASIERRGLNGIAAGHFARMVLGAPGGACAKLLSLRGPHLSLSIGRGSGLLAIVSAAEHLAARNDADLILAGGLDELPAGQRQARAEGASFAALAAGGEHAGAPRLAGWALAGPAQLDIAVAGALSATGEVDGVVGAMPGLRQRLAGGSADPAHLPLGLLDVDAVAAGAESTSSAWAFALAVAMLRRREARRLLVVAGGNSATCAAALAAADA
ncbi:MAG TPA: beta-ketoacyl-[acyl-carrier-protein] synthase family protein [Myxococcales bacterium]|nr:beta-ketoacyl-[acyl-carrier-protein] synthase family protein [Myxococcales bacterium]